MEKILLSIVIPSYNASNYIDVCMHSILNESTVYARIHKKIEIIIINDGSRDDTIEKANNIAERWNNELDSKLVTVVDKDNGQYGSVINTGIKIAKGKYFKVMDVDDTFDVKALIDVVTMIEGFSDNHDVIYTDHTYEKISVNKRITQTLKTHFPKYTTFNLDDIKYPKDLITMHSIIYRLDFLLEINYKQLEGVYYSDSQYSIIPLQYAKSAYYIPLPLYRYYIGRADQSININVMIKNKEHQLNVLRALIKEVNLSKVNSKNKRKFISLSLRRMLQWSHLIIFMDRLPKKDAIEIVKQLKKEITEMNPKLKKQLYRGVFFITLKVSRGYGFKTILKLGLKIYSIFNKNIMEDWE